ncbi:hypothetical protein [Saccharicrinis sp. GN24d3]|uniref:hypothetical protein n=1 Tax=Saccharicrinis sp. GN24d3 TaxID=3458416 RepID=UPI004035B9DD
MCNRFSNAYCGLKTISKLYDNESFNLVTPVIGEQVFLNENKQDYRQWWADEKTAKIAIK